MTVHSSGRRNDGIARPPSPRPTDNSRSTDRTASGQATPVPKKASAEGRGHEQDHQRGPGSHLNCKTKARLKLAGEAGTPSDYEAMSVEARRASREAVLAKLVARFPDASRSVPANAETLKEGKPLLVDATFEDDGMSIASMP